MRPLLALALAALAAGPAHAAVIFSNFGPGDTYTINSGYAVGEVPGAGQGNFVIAVRFTPADTVTFDAARLALFRAIGAGTDPLFVTLSADGGNEPGAVLETLTVNSVQSTSGQINTVTSSLNPVLTAGAPYWLVASTTAGTSLYAWNLNSTGDTGTGGT